MRTKYFEIIISGFTDKPERVDMLISNLDVEIAAFEHCWISEPKIIEIEIPSDLFEVTP